MVQIKHNIFKCHLNQTMIPENVLLLPDHIVMIELGISTWSQILASASSIFFGFLLNIAVNSPSYFRFLDNVILLAALYAVTVATAMFIMPVIYHIESLSSV